MRGYSDQQLVAIAKMAGDRAAFDELFQRQHAKLRAFLLSTRFAATDISMIDDIMQETYLKAFTSIQRFAGNSTFSTWLFAIAMNECRQWRRKSNVVEKLKSAFSFKHDEPRYTPQLNVLIDFTERAKALSAAQYETYVLSAVYGFSHSEIACRLELPLGSVKSYIAQAERILRVEVS